MQSLKGVLPDRAVQVLTGIQQSLSTLNTRFEQFISSKPLTKDQATEMFGPQAQRQALSASGSHPMNVAGLIGSGFFLVPAPSSHSAPGNPGQAAYDSTGAFFLCYAQNSWARINSAGWSNSF